MYTARVYHVLNWLDRESEVGLVKNLQERARLARTIEGI